MPQRQPGLGGGAPRNVPALAIIRVFSRDRMGVRCQYSDANSWLKSIVNNRLKILRRPIPKSIPKFPESPPGYRSSATRPEAEIRDEEPHGNVRSWSLFSSQIFMDFCKLGRPGIAGRPAERSGVLLNLCKARSWRCWVQAQPFRNPVPALPADSLLAAMKNRPQAASSVPVGRHEVCPVTAIKDAHRRRPTETHSRVGNPETTPRCHHRATTSRDSSNWRSREGQWPLYR